MVEHACNFGKITYKNGLAIVVTILATIHIVAIAI